MKKRLYFLFLLFSIQISFAQTKIELDSAINDFCKKIMFKNPYGFKNQHYAELSFLKRSYGLPYLTINDSIFISRQSDYYYKQLFPYSKLMREDAVVTEDCLFDEANLKIHQSTKLFFYTLYPNSMCMPDNIVDLLEQYATTDEFFGPYNFLQSSYFLKKYNHKNLSQKQKDKLAAADKFYTKLLFTKYVENKQPWEFYKFLSVKVLKMNKSELVEKIDIGDLVQYFIKNGPLQIGEADTKNIDLLKRVGANKMMQYEINALLWIFLLEAEKI